MYGWIWRHIPGPFIFKFLLSLILIFVSILALMEWVFPWAALLSPFSQSTTVE